jgi:potassium/hydrogen antiporter
VLWTGLKGAVPILLGTFIVKAGVAGGHRAYEIIFVVVAFSVIVQGGLVPVLARRLGVPLRVVDPKPWGTGVRFTHEPEALHRYTVAAGSHAADTALADLPSDDVWISLIIRDGQLVAGAADTALRAGDEVLVIRSDTADVAAIAAIFTRPKATKPPET